mmetsp:Transcript_78110/g.253438  ORF Transcript_78110/g.253438 Transcript_78110/m.253438 type:complete len:209 (-) Transcript_78110:1359-1985(-)
MASFVFSRVLLLQVKEVIGQFTRSRCGTACSLCGCVWSATSRLATERRPCSRGQTNVWRRFDGAVAGGPACHCFAGVVQQVAQHTGVCSNEALTHPLCTSAAPARMPSHPKQIVQRVRVPSMQPVPMGAAKLLRRPRGGRRAQSGQVGQSGEKEEKAGAGNGSQTAQMPRLRLRSSSSSERAALMLALKVPCCQVPRRPSVRCWDAAP